jgi:hypothetical protein
VSAQLRLLPEPAPTIPADSVFGRCGSWIVGEGERPPELALATAIRIQTDKHRAGVRASWGGR